MPMLSTAARSRCSAVATAAIVTGLLALTAAAVAPISQPVLPPHRDAVTAIVSVLDSVPLVAIMDEHLLAQEGDFYQRLIRDPRFSQKANDIVVEFGNELYQSVADRYVSGERVSPDSLRMIWEDNTQGPLLTFSSPMYANILHAAREVNEKLPTRRRLRVLLGDPAVEWKTVTREELWELHKRRGDRMRELARDSVVGKHRRGIIIGGGSHLRRGRVDAQGRDAKWGELGSRVFIINPHEGFGGSAARFEAVLDSLPLGSLVPVRGTFLETIAVDDASQEVPGVGATAPAAPETPRGMRRAQAVLRLGDHYDALLYLGPIRSYTAVFADVGRIRADPVRLTALHRRSCMMMGRGVDTTRLFRTPATAPLFPNGRRASRVELDDGADSGPRPLPPLPANLPEPCQSLLRP
jgi:hypothetical protein